MNSTKVIKNEPGETETVHEKEKDHETTVDNVCHRPYCRWIVTTDIVHGYSFQTSREFLYENRDGITYLYNRLIDQLRTVTKAKINEPVIQSMFIQFVLKTSARNY
jgi:hypothetical protein